MKYISTRDPTAKEFSFIDAVIEGLAPDGGLFVPKEIPKISETEWREWKSLSYSDLCLVVMKKFVTEISDEELKAMIEAAYKSFRVPDVVNLVETDKNMHVMELFHGPTFAFKDVALQLLGQLFDYALRTKNSRMTILGATSGDTGSAAIAGVKGRTNINCVILFPLGKTSQIQEAQMTANLDANIHCLAVKNSDFDDCQSIVKACFNDPLFNAEKHLGAVNSINWARILAQIVYYVFAAARFENPPVFVVPTGNFGDVLAGYYAKKMGVPMRLVIASNQNDILPRFFKTGEYKINGPVIPSLSPSMDIAVSSNFERFLFDLFGRNGATVAQKFAELNVQKSFTVTPKQLEEANSVFEAFAVSESETIETIRRVFKDHDYLLCPHSAVAYAAALRCSGGPIVALATAHVGKFTDDVLKKLVEPNDSVLRNAITNSVPSELAQLVHAEKRRIDIDNNVEAVKQYLREHV